MKRIFTSLSLVLLFFFTVTAKAPKWAVKKPAADNDTYRYVVESATSMESSNAKNKALGHVYQDAIMSLGIPISSAQVQNAIRTGDFESITIEFKIPVHLVCDYIEKLSSGGVRVYVLCQVGVKSDRVQKPQFTEFRNCGPKGDTDVEISGRPDEWERFEEETYSTAFLEKELANGEDEIVAQRDLTKEVRQNLVINLNMTQDDDVVDALIQTEQFYSKQKKTVYAVAYVDMNMVIKIYSDKVNDAINICDRMVQNVQSYINEGNTNSAKAIIDIIQDKIKDDIDPRLNFLRVYCTNRSVNHLIEDVSALKATITDIGFQVQGGVEKNKEGKIQEFVRSAENSLKERKLADALRYYYAAQVLLKEIPDGTSLTIKPNDYVAAVNANLYITNSIKSILTDVKISFDGFFSESEAKLGFLYKGEAITNLDYKYNDNSGLSHTQSVRDGWTIIQLPTTNRPKTIQVILEYKYKDEASFDPELMNVINKYKFNYDKQAMHIVEVKEIKMETSKQNVSVKASTDMNQNIVADRTIEKKHIVLESDSAKYMEVISKVCESINKKSYKDIYQFFSANGCKQLDTLLNYGNARVISSSFCRFIRIGDEVMCRSIPMQFTFKKGKMTQENVVFTFDSLGKIDGIQFALEERSARNIMADKNYSETTKLTLVNFMENYKTAFAMKRLNYINSIFADDAVIIVGRVLRKTNNVDISQRRLNDEIEYTRFSKGEYIARLARQFASKEWINLKFSNTKFQKSAQGEIYAIQLLQDYSSDNYGDRGYLFLLIDCSNPDQPLIKVRTWQPETAEAKPFSMADYEEIINKSINWK